ncbi:MAG: hypothetical protein V4480_05015 [Patescibacteria group bacterium]
MPRGIITGLFTSATALFFNLEAIVGPLSAGKGAAVVVGTIFAGLTAVAFVSEIILGVAELLKAK